MSMNCPSSSILINFGLKPILLDIRIGTLACVLETCTLEIFSNLLL